ncbi:hypothetical protein [Kineococcus esterisolvens]|uniref:hypothetical protein n=1 Tax=unclassified Kineococcus TaxID=2621656 RepID=UPI003D7D8253
MSRTYAMTARTAKGALGVLLILLVPLLIWHHPLADPALMLLPAGVGLHLLGVPLPTWRQTDPPAPA